MIDINRICSIIATEFQQITFFAVILIEKPGHTGKQISVSDSCTGQFAIVINECKSDCQTFE